MSRLDDNIEIIGKLKGTRSEGWEFLPSVQGERVNLRIQRINSPVATSMQFVNRVVFSDWLEGASNELDINLDNGINAKDVLLMMMAG